jgi:hypothetical protein
VNVAAWVTFRSAPPHANVRGHGVTNRKLWVAGAALTAALVVTPASGIAVEAGEPPAWPTSPFHGVIDGDGKRIPCRCRFQGRAFKLGDTVCMTTHLGVQLARCDLYLNNTSWVPTGVPCTMSSLSPRHAKLSAP